MFKTSMAKFGLALLVLAISHCRKDSQDSLPFDFDSHPIPDKLK